MHTSQVDRCANSTGGLFADGYNHFHFHRTAGDVKCHRWIALPMSGTWQHDCWLGGWLDRLVGWSGFHLFCTAGGNHPENSQNRQDPNLLKE